MTTRDEKLRLKVVNAIAGIDVEGRGDNLAILLCSVFENHPDHPDDEENAEGENGWSPWTTKMTEAAIAEIAAAAIAAVQAHDAAAGREEADHFAGLVGRARISAEKASRKFPQPNYVTLKIAEEAGEVVRGAVHYAEGRMEWAEVEGEVVQLLAMLIRFVTEGDQVNGVTPPLYAAPRMEGE